MPCSGRPDCKNDLKSSPQLLLAAEWHARDLMANRNLGGDNGSDGSTPQQRADAAGFRGAVARRSPYTPRWRSAGSS